MSSGSGSISRSIRVQAPAEQVWDLVSDLPGMGRLSPENTGGSWRRGATGPAVGAVCKGRNRNGWRSWSTTVRVTRCERGRAFGFAVSSFLGIPVSEWAYLLSPLGPDACEVTESWTDRRPRWFAGPAGLVTGVPDRTTSTAANLELTLASVRDLAEARAAR
jgi:hypothetical protein